VLADRLARQSRVCAQLSQRLSVVRMQAVEQVASRGIGEGAENGVGAHRLIMQPKGCM
jgi:hypothetical protein